MPPPFYVALCHLRPTPGVTQPVMENFAQMLRDSGAIVRRINNAGVRPLPIEMRGKSVGERHKFASITTVEFVSNPQVAITTTHQLRAVDDILRVSLLRADDILTKPPPRPRKSETSTSSSSSSSSSYTSKYDRSNTYSPYKKVSNDVTKPSTFPSSRGENKNERNSTTTSSDANNNVSEMKSKVNLGNNEESKS